MEIQKVFSDYYDEERVYSVLLTEDEMDLYQYMFSDEVEGGLAGAGATGLGLGALAAGGYGARKGLASLVKRERANRIAEYESAVSEKVGKNSNVKKALKNLEKATKEYEKAAEEFGPGVTPTGPETPRLNYAKKKLKQAQKEARDKVVSAKGKNAVKMREAGLIERLSRKGSSVSGKISRALKNNKKAALITTGGLVAAGAGTGAYLGHNRD